MVPSDVQAALRFEGFSGRRCPLAACEPPLGGAIAGEPGASDPTDLAGTDLSVRIVENDAGTVCTGGSQDVFYVLKGRARIELDTGQVIEMGPGDIGRVPDGHVAVWTFFNTFRIVYLTTT